MSDTAPHKQPRTWVLWVVRGTFTLTVLNLLIGDVAIPWIARDNPVWWLLIALPQVCVALLAVLICWAPDSRPDGLGLITIMLNVFGMMAALLFLKWLPLLIGALTILALCVRPRGKLFIEASPPPSGWPRL